MTIRAVIWDVGGVLVRTEDFAPRERLAKRLSMTRGQLEKLVFAGESGEHVQRGLISVEEHWDNVRRSLNLPAEAMQEFQSDFWAGDRLDCDLVDYIRSLRSSYKTALLSNAFPTLRRLIAQIWHFEDAFDEMIISSEIGILKPDPRIYHSALQRLGVEPPEAVFIDDFLDNVEGARSLNMRAVHFQDPFQARDELERILNAGGLL